MTTSGTYTWAPDYGDIFDESFERCGIDPATLGARHVASAIRSANLLMVELSVRKVTLFDTDEQSVTLTQGQGDYSSMLAAADGTILVLGGIVRRAGRDTPIYPISWEMYQKIPSKTQQGLPTSLWYDITQNKFAIWTIAENSTDAIRYRRLRRKQDVGAMAETPDAPYLYANAICSGMAWLLAGKFAPERKADLEVDFEKALARAQLADREFTDVAFDMRLG